jgi:hypothetical protein
VIAIFPHFIFPGVFQFKTDSRRREKIARQSRILKESILKKKEKTKPFIRNDVATVRCITAWKLEVIFEIWRLAKVGENERHTD